MDKPEHTGATHEVELEAGVVWLEDEYFTLIEDEPSDTERRSRYDDTQRIWCPPRD
jgi:hypothetical protein